MLFLIFFFFLFHFTGKFVYCCIRLGNWNWNPNGFQFGYLHKMILGSFGLIADDWLIIDLLTASIQSERSLIMHIYSLHSNFHMQMMPIQPIYRPTYMCNRKTATIDQVRRNLCKFLRICYANRPSPHLHISNSFLCILFRDSWWRRERILLNTLRPI